MLAAAFRHPLAGQEGRDALVTCTALVLLGLLALRVARALWPTSLALAATGLAVLPALAFAGYLGEVLRGADRERLPRFRWSGGTLLVGLRVLAVGTAYLAVPAAVLLGSVALLVGADGGGLGPLVAVAPTAALLALVAVGYFLPAALSAAVEEGLRAGLSRGALGGLASGSYFVAWTVAAATVVVAWGLLWTAGIGSPLAIPGALLVAYGHLAAARLVAEGLARSRWTPGT